MKVKTVFCKYLQTAARITAFREKNNLTPIKYIGMCNGINDIDGYLEDEDCHACCYTDEYVNCSVFKYMDNKCKNLSLKLARGGKYKLPIADLDEAKYKHVCKKAKNMEDEDNFVFCDEDNYINCPIYKGEFDS